jgi:diguanylate cyclase (GGDEF)-like protein
VPGLLDSEPLERVFSAWRRVLRQDPLLSRVPTPELRPLAEAFNLALTGEDDGDALPLACEEMARHEADATTLIRVTTVLAESFTDEVGTESGAVTKGLVSTLGHVCALMTTTMVADERIVARRDVLTGLENKLAWEDAMREAALRGEDITVALIDLDGLKLINDTVGHLEGGNPFLRKFASDLAQSLPEGVSAYRFMGDEYAVHWPGAEEAELVTLLEQLREKEGVAQFGFGVARGVPDPDEPEALTVVADGRLLANKAERREGNPPDPR